jgi:hypothetical protein
LLLLSITPGRRFLKCFNFGLLKNVTCARHRGQIAPNQDVRLLVMVCQDLMVRGREHSSTGSGPMMVRSGGGPISHPTVQPSRSWKYVETGTSLYVQPRRQTKLVDTFCGDVQLLWFGKRNGPFYAHTTYNTKITSLATTATHGSPFSPWWWKEQTHN